MQRHQQTILSYLACLSLFFAGPISGIDLHFDDPTSGYLIKETTSNSQEDGSLGDDEPSLSSKFVSNLTVFGSQRSVKLKASHGPFLSSQTIAVSTFLDTNTSDTTDLVSRLSDLSAHLVTKEVTKDKPVLRLLFHSNHPLVRDESRRPTVCILVSVVLANKTVEDVCVGKGDDGTCLAQVTIPSSWWPPITGADSGKKMPRLMTSVYYSVRTIASGGECTVVTARDVTRATVHVPPQHVADVPLTSGQSGYQQVSGDEILHMLVPQTSLYPDSRLYVPVFVEQPGEGPMVSVIVIKCRARRGVRIQGIEETTKDWTLRIDLNSRGSVATVTAFRKDSLGDNLVNEERGYTGPHELFNWLFAVDDSEKTDLWDGGLLVWHIKYQHATSDLLDEDLSNMTKSSRLKHRLDIKKDDVQMVLPISKQFELMNTAVMTGRQVSQSMKIFVVSESGSVADVTLHTSCSTTDAAALKVSSSCTSVYVDGSESRGALNAEIKIVYGSFSGQAYFTVWMPETPLKLEIPDKELAMIKDWKISNSIERGYQKRAAELQQSNWRDHFEEQTKKFDEKQTKLIEEISEDDQCQTRYQQTNIRVFARFLAEDLDSGRREYMISRNTMLDVTDLTLASVRVSDARVVSITGDIIHGHAPGSVTVQVLSPITNQVLGSSQVTVTKSKETITGLKARVLSGITMSVSGNTKITNQFTVESALSEKLSSKYQEGLLDITVVFSDGNSTPLRLIASDQYYLTVDTLDSEVIAFAPILGSKDTRVIAVGKGQGELLKVSLELADDCHDKTDDPLASTRVYVEVDFDAADPKPPATEERHNKGNGVRKGRGGRKRKEQKSLNDIKSVDMGEIFSNIAMRDDNRRRVSADLSPYDVHSPHQTNVFDTGHHGASHQATPLEVGMYILLAVFCVAIAVFMASCFVYASKHSSQPPAHHPRQLHNKSQSVQNAHDWVWLGRQTLDKSSVATSGSRDMLDTGTCQQTRGQYRGQYPQRFEAAADVNIIQNPGAGPEFGFVNKRGLKVSNFSPDVYAELPRKRWPRQTHSPQPHSSHGSVYGNDHINSRSPFLPHKHIQQHHAPPSSDSSLDRTGSRHVSPTGSHVSSRVNSATYTRRKPVVPSVDILPVGYPVFSVEDGGQCSGQDDAAMMGFQNPWEALQMVRNQKQQEINILNNNTTNKLHEYFDEDEENTVPHDLKLELADTTGAQPELRQSPASGLPPTDQETTYVISPEHIQQRGEYIPLNPDINKATPPRKGASKMFSDPFNVSDKEAPPVTEELLSPSHIFSSLENIQSQFAAADNDNVSLTSVSGADCSSVCSVDSSELERDLPSPGSNSSGSMSRRHIKNILDNAAIVRSALDTQPDNDNPTNSTDLNSVPLGSLDYSHLMNYFESLKESAA